MFKHAQAPNQDAGKEEKMVGVAEPVVSVADKNKPLPALNRDTTVLKELIEKNLKWSQIIYEQNRKINNKLMWMAIASWVKLFIILVPLILAVLFLPPVIKDAWSQYSQLLGVGASESAQQAKFFDTLINLSNLDPAKQEQIKAMLK